MLTNEEVIKKTVEKWYDERKFTDESVIRKKPRGGCGKNGHYTQLIWHNTCFVGCAGARYINGNKNYGYIVCNYNSGNMVDNEIYSIGETATECKTGTHKKYNGLCSSREVFKLPEAHSLKAAHNDVKEDNHNHHNRNHRHYDGGVTHYHHHHHRH